MTLPNAKERDELKAVIGEITQSMYKMDMERDVIKEAIAAASKKYGVEKKQLRKLATTMYNSDYADKQAENREFEELYEAIIEGNTSKVVELAGRA